MNDLPLWTEVCESLASEKIILLKNLVKTTATSCLKEAFDFDEKSDTDFSSYINSLAREKFCEYLSKYYISSKCKTIVHKIVLS